MLVSFLTLSLLGAPRSPAGAQTVSWVPRLEQVQGLAPFLRAAGTRSGLLRPEAWREYAHPLLSIDLLDAASVTQAGLDPAGELTRSDVDGFVVTCAAVADAAVHRDACAAKLKRLGEVSSRQVNGVTVTVAVDPLGRALGAFALQGKQACAMTGLGRSVEPRLALLAQAMTKPAPPTGQALLGELKGALVTFAEADGVVGVGSLSARGLAARLDVRARNLRLPTLANAGPSPFAGFAPAGAAALRYRLTKRAVEVVTAQAVQRLPGAEALAAVAPLVSAQLTGNAALLLSHVRVTGGLRTERARFFALRSALLLEVADAGAVQAALDALDPAKLAFREGTLTVSLHGRVLVLANDADVKARALAALEGAAGRQAHGLEVVVDPKLTAKALAEVPLLEAVRAPELAGVVAASAELGPLLLATERVSGWLDSAAGNRHLGQLAWTLDAAKFAVDAGAP